MFGVPTYTLPLLPIVGVDGYALIRVIHFNDPEGEIAYKLFAAT